ncbi:methyltransferase domain-containing protein [Saccharopolyspora erythraea]|uniref:methyltransferase domain-containing protein n=2 Tax=Saccharopolyspora erythraea TaxID=1836 RepID=UPI0031F9B7E6
MSLSTGASSSTEASRISEVLRGHEGVRDVFVLPNTMFPQTGAGLVAYVVPEVAPDDHRRAVRHGYTAIADKITADSRGRESGTDCDERNSHLVAKSVLELACGSGRERLARAIGAEHYFGLDLSFVALSDVGAAARRGGLGHVELTLGDTIDAELFEGDDFELVVCDSPVHRFPDAEYLRRALTAALAATGPGGRVHFGGIRDLPLVRAMHAASVVSGAPDDVAGSILEERWRRQLSEQDELLVDARWFRDFPGAAHVEVRPRPADSRESAAPFSFDVVAWRDGTRRTVEVPTWLHWSVDARDRAAAMLADRVEALGLRRVPRAGVAGAVKIARVLESRTGTPAGELRMLAAEVDAAAVRPEHLAALGARYGYDCRFSRAGGWPDGELDVAFVRRSDDQAPGSAPLPRFPFGELGDRAPANDPVHHSLLAEARAWLVPELRRHAAKALPAHQRPLVHHVVAELPRTEHGAVDLAMLPAPDETPGLGLLDRTAI